MFASVVCPLVKLANRPDLRVRDEIVSRAHRLSERGLVPYAATELEFMVFDDTDPRWEDFHDHILDFFALAFRLVRESKGNPASTAMIQAQNLLLFPEPAEFCRRRIVVPAGTVGGLASR